MRFPRWITWLGAPIFAVTPASADQNKTYTYDVLGRLVQVARSGTVNNGATECYAYDPANNRSNVTVQTTSDCAAVTLTLSPTALANGTIGTAYSQSITTSGWTTPYTYATTAGALPAGLSLSSSGVLSGTPTTAATSNFTITATDSASHTGNRAYSLTVASSGNQPPHAVNDTGSQQKCTSKTYNVVANDTDPEGNYPLVVVSVTGTNFSVVSSTSVEFDAANVGGVGTYTVRDSLGATNTATLSVSVTGSCTSLVGS
jgi:hypothetical protein